MEEEEQHQYVDLGDSSDGDIEVIDITEETSPVRRRPRPRYRSPMALYKDNQTPLIDLTDGDRCNIKRRRISKEGPVAGDSNEDIVVKLCNALMCPVCQFPVTNLAATQCGHLFCHECIQQAVTVQKKCPTCRAKATPKQIFRIYF